MLTLHTVLDAPRLRDDFYCSLLAYSQTADFLAVGLGNFIHLWSEGKGVVTPDSIEIPTTTYVTSLDFSSTVEGSSILAIGRADGRITLWSPFDEEPRFDASQPFAVSCVSFSPVTTKRSSQRDVAHLVNTESLLVGDDTGSVYLYAVEWPGEVEGAIFDWHGSMTLLAKISVHSQQICGIAWSPHGDLFATGGNDNLCHLFETQTLLQSHQPLSPVVGVNVEENVHGERRWRLVPGQGSVQSASSGCEKHKWVLSAAVKAIAFCPWQAGLLAVGGGSNDRCIHFYHTITGALLATIDCAAQVTSLIWSAKRREVCATFGFAQPDHPFRIAVFSWPSCEQVVAIP